MPRPRQHAHKACAHTRALRAGERHTVAGGAHLRAGGPACSPLGIGRRTRVPDPQREGLPGPGGTRPGGRPPRGRRSVTPRETRRETPGSAGRRPSARRRRRRWRSRRARRPKQSRRRTRAQWRQRPPQPAGGESERGERNARASKALRKVTRASGDSASQSAGAATRSVNSCSRYGSSLVRMVTARAQAAQTTRLSAAFRACRVACTAAALRNATAPQLPRHDMHANLCRLPRRPGAAERGRPHRRPPP
jgi:hypothetical protein